MRKVVGCALFTPSLGDRAGERFSEVCDVVKRWLDSKGTWEEEDLLRLNDGRPAKYSRAEWLTDDDSVIDHYLVEPSNDATVRTQVSVGRCADRVIVYIELQAAGDAYRVAPIHVDIYSPNIVKTLISEYDDWCLGEVPLAARPVPFEGDDGGRTFQEVLWHPERNLPVVAVTSFEGFYLTDDFPQKLAYDLAGVALVATLDFAAALSLTRRRGQEWSCFNGAVRLYWPGLTVNSKPLANPIWTRSSLMTRASDTQVAATRIRRQLRRMLLGMSEFAIPEPKEISAIRRLHATRVEAEQRRTLVADEDWQQLATQYSEDNARLVVQHQADQDQIQELQRVIGQLQLSMRWTDQAEHEVAPDEDVQPTTVAEALQMAEGRYPDLLVFGDDVAGGVAGVATDAGPPEKILRFLGTLADLTQAKRAGPLGTTTVDWLNDRNATASTESETIRNSAAERRARTWDAGGEKRFFDLHLKPAEATHPDRCVRIYFEYDETMRCVVVGWVGRHP